MAERRGGLVRVGVVAVREVWIEAEIPMDGAMGLEAGRRGGGGVESGVVLDGWEEGMRSCFGVVWG